MQDIKQLVKNNPDKFLVIVIGVCSGLSNEILGLLFKR